MRPPYLIALVGLVAFLLGWLIGRLHRRPTRVGCQNPWHLKSGNHEPLMGRRSDCYTTYETWGGGQ